MARKKGNAKASSAGRKKQNDARRPSIGNYKKAQIVVLGAIAVVAVLLQFVGRKNDAGKLDGQSVGPPIPHIDVSSMKLDPERGNETEDFLNNFVCNHEPETDREAEPETEAENDTITKAVDIGGYCHPRLSAAPRHRTQRVSFWKGSVNDSPRKKGWQKILGLVSGENELAGENSLPAGELVMKLPRPLQIWDLDALRDKFIQQEFLGLAVNGDLKNVLDRSSSKVFVRHKHTNNPLDSGAFLAVHLLRLLHGSQAEKSLDESSNDGQCQNESELWKSVHWNDLEQHKLRINLLSPYLNILPTVEDRLSKKSPSSTTNPHSHPLFWSLSLLESLFPRHTHTYDLVRHYQQMIESEFDALKLMSRELGKNVNYLDYLNMRINVLSRAFGVSATAGDNGALWGNTNDDGKGFPLMAEMRSYQTSNFGSYLDDAPGLDDEAVEELKLRSMCPLLDMYNSHPNPNVLWRRESKTSSYLIHAKRNIPPGHSIVVSYGKYTEGHLFAKYGFVNGDGSSPTEISLAVFHRMLGDVGLGRQYSPLPFQVWDPGFRDEFFSSVLNRVSKVDYKMRKSLLSARQVKKVQAKELLRYLLFDDGYEECIRSTNNSNSDDDELKLLKLRHLIHVANYRDVWLVRLQPRFPDAQPLQLSANVKRAEQNNNVVGVNARLIVSLCRLLSLRTDDIGGKATDHIREGLTSLIVSSKPFFFVEKQNDALEYRAMMCVNRLAITALGRYLGQDNTEPDLAFSREWNAWYIKSGEVRSLGIIQQTAANEAQKLKQQYQSSKGATAATNPAFTVREEPCLLNYSLPLLNRL